jgi:uncharacterized membrane protein
VTPLQKFTAAMFSTAGILHFAIPKSYEATVPDYIPMSAHDAVLYSGVAELAGGIGVVLPQTRRIAGFGLIALLVAVFPANVHMALNPEQVRGLDLKKIPRWALWARLPLQFVMIWQVWTATQSA